VAVELYDSANRPDCFRGTPSLPSIGHRGIFPRG